MFYLKNKIKLIFSLFKFFMHCDVSFITLVEFTYFKPKSDEKNVVLLF